MVGDIELEDREKVQIQFRDIAEEKSGKFAEVRFGTVQTANKRQFRLGGREGYFASHVSECHYSAR